MTKLLFRKDVYRARLLQADALYARPTPSLQACRSKQGPNEMRPTDESGYRISGPNLREKLP